jgi:CBS domain-containing protein
MSATEVVATPTAAKPAAEAVASPAAAPAAPAAETEDEEVEPEIISLPRPKPKPASHHPPPPPSVRFKSILADASGAGVKLAEARFPVSGKPKVAKDLMSRKLFTIEPSDTLEHLEEHMAAFRFRHLPVIDGDRLVGLITHRDLLHASSSFLSDRARERDEIIHKLPASRIMRTELVTARPDTPLDQIAKQMWLKKIGCVLIIEQDGSLVGIITESDFIRLAHHFLVQAS